MMRKPPSFVVTTPESLYLLVTSASGRDALRTVETVIVDEIHAVARDKRGSHLSLTLERLEALCEQPPEPRRAVGDAATDRDRRPPAGRRPGAAGDRRRAATSATSTSRSSCPKASSRRSPRAEQMADVLDRIAALVAEHRTTLVFVNTRRLAERFAHQLGERLGDDVVAAHHGSLSKDRRYRVETRLRAGELKALVATASLELGIDIGPVELVCQIGSPRSIATFLQRVGRSNHSRRGVPKGRLYPMTRDELIECAALLGAVRAGRLDAIAPPGSRSTSSCSRSSPRSRRRSGAPTSSTRSCAGPRPTPRSTREQFDEVVELVADGVETGRGPRGRYVHHDAVNGEVRGRKGARLAALTSGGAIPEIGDYRVVAEPDDTVHRHRQRGLGGRVDGRRHLPARHALVADPPHRSRRRAGARRRQRAADDAVLDGRGTGAHRRAVRRRCRRCATRVDAFLAAGDPDGARAWLARDRRDRRRRRDDDRRLPRGRRARCSARTPTLDTLVLERFFDETGGMQLVDPLPVRRPDQPGVRARAAQEVLPHVQLRAPGRGQRRRHRALARPAPQLPARRSRARYVRSCDVEETLEQAILDAPMFQSRWRWNLNRVAPRAAVPRRPAQPAADPAHGGRRPHGRGVPAGGGVPGQHGRARSRSPTTSSCARRSTTPCTKRSTSTACATLLERIEAGEVTVHTRRHHRTVGARARDPHRAAVRLPRRRGVPEPAHERGAPPARAHRRPRRRSAALEPEAIAQVHEEITPQPETADDLHDLLVLARHVPPRPRRVGALVASCVGAGPACVVERRRRGGSGAPPRCVDDAAAPSPSDDTAVAAVLRGHLELAGITTVDDARRRHDLAAGRVASAARGCSNTRAGAAGQLHRRRRATRVGGAPPARRACTRTRGAGGAGRRARDRAGLHAVPPALAAPRTRDAARRRRRARDGRRPAPGMGGGGGRVGARAARAGAAPTTSPPALDRLCHDGEVAGCA